MLSKKGKYIMAAVCAVIALVFVARLGGGGKNNIVGTWYGDSPDMLTLTRKNEYRFEGWDGGQPWLLPGRYNVSGDTLTLSNALDGSVTLKIVSDKDGTRLVGKYTYYETEKKARAAMAAALALKEEKEKNLVRDTIEILLGEWVSKNGMTTCTFTETTIVVHYKGCEIIPEKFLHYEYEILSDRSMRITEEGRVYRSNYSLDKSDGVWNLHPPVKSYTTHYTKAADD